jgi:UTP-glucose-1-phosphate uridylyltransferase
MVENPKPEEAPSNLAITGRYILTPTVFQTLAETPMGTGGELQLTDGMRLLLRREKMYAYVYEGKRHDTGDKLGFLKATVEFALLAQTSFGHLSQSKVVSCFSIRSSATSIQGTARQAKHVLGFAHEGA